MTNWHFATKLLELIKNFKRAIKYTRKTKTRRNSKYRKRSKKSNSP